MITIKRVCLLLLFALMGGSQSLLAQLPEQLWERANGLYIDRNYSEASKEYTAIVEQGYVSSKLYLNLGNAYFKQQLYGRAILNYNCALRLDPGNEEAKYNLKVANSFIQDKIEAVPTFFLERWAHAIRTELSSNSWAILSVIFLLIFAICLVSYLLMHAMIWRKVGFYGGIISVSFSLLTMLWASRQKYDLLHPSEAIVMVSAAAVKSSPDAQSKEIFVLHEGTKVKIKDALGEFREIQLADGNEGWIEFSSIALIE